MNTARRIVLETLRQQMKELRKGLETQQNFEKQQEIEKHLENVIDLYVNYHPPLEVEASCFIDQTCYWGYIPQQ